MRPQTGRSRYPVATISFYGPHNARATKLVVGIVRKPGASPNPMRTWTTSATDIRRDPVTANEMAYWLHSQGVKETVTHDRIIGCPHQEGIDYPLGRTCPQCPFWAAIDRFTHEPLPVPVATMSPEQVLNELSRDRPTQPLEALESADAHRDALVQPLLDVLERGISDPRSVSDEEAQLHSYALYLLARWRETRAYPLAIRWLSLPDDDLTQLSGDVWTQDGARILAAVCDGDLEPIKRLVVNRDADEIARGVAVTALALLGVWGEVPLDVIVDYFTWLANDGLEREPSYVWGALAAESADIGALAVFPALHRAYEEGLIDPKVVGRSELDDVESQSRQDLLEAKQNRQPPIDDIAEATGWWARFARARSPRSPEGVRRGTGGTAQPYRAPEKVGRNAPCPCGSGKKHKKCCGA